MDMYARSPAVSQIKLSRTLWLTTKRSSHKLEICWCRPRRLPSKSYHLNWPQKKKLSYLCVYSHVRIYDSNSVTSGSFNHKEFFNSSATDLGSIVLHSKKLSSTSDYLIEWVLLYAIFLLSTYHVWRNFASYPVGTVCVADEQTSGRGRG